MFSNSRILPKILAYYSWMIINQFCYVADLLLRSLVSLFHRPKDIVRKLVSGDSDLGIASPAVTKYGQVSMKIRKNCVVIWMRIPDFSIDAVYISQWFFLVDGAKFNSYNLFFFMVLEDLFFKKRLFLGFHFSMLFFVLNLFLMIIYGPG